MGFTAAKAGNHVALSNLLIPRGADLNKIQGVNGRKIEHYLAQSDGIFLFKMRYHLTNDPLQPLKEEEGKTLAYLAGENGSWRILEFLLEQLKTQQLSLENHYQGRHLFYSVLETGDLEGIRLFVEKMNDPHLVNQSLIQGKKFFPVHLAAKMGSEEILAYLYHCGAQLTIQDSEGEFPLFYAIQGRNQRAIQFLIEAKNGCPITANSIFSAVRLQNEEIFLHLLKAGADLDNNSHPQQDTALLLAIKQHDLGAFSKLVQQGASLTCKNKEGWTPLLLASHEGELEMLEMILARTKQPQQEKINGNHALHLACQQGHGHCIQPLINKGFSIDESNAAGKNPIALAEKNVEVRAALNLEPSKKNYQIWTKILHTAISAQDLTPLLKSLDTWPVNAYFNIHWHGLTLRGTVLHIALMTHSNSQQLDNFISQIVQKKEFNTKLKNFQGDSYAHLMLKANIDPIKFKVFGLNEANHRRQFPLHAAASEGNLENLNQLIQELNKTQSNLNEEDEKGNTPLFYSIQKNRRKQIALLVKNGARLNHRNHLGITPLIRACQLGYYPIIRTLIKHGADVNYKGGGAQMTTPLSESLLAKGEDIPLFLLFSGAKLNQVNVKGKQIGHVAALKGKMFILRFLSEQGLSLSSFDNQGFQPIHDAVLGKKLKSLEFLASQGIFIDTPVAEVNSPENKNQIFGSATPFLLTRVLFKQFPKNPIFNRF